MIIPQKKAASSVEETAFVLFPFAPNFRAVTNGGLFAITDDRCLHQGRIVINLVFLGNFIVHILHVRNPLALGIPVNQIVNATHRTKDTVKFLAGHAVFFQVNGLELDPAFLEIALSFFGVETF